MPKMTLKLHRSGVFDAGLTERVDAFLAADLEARKLAARRATEASRRVWNARTNKRDLGGTGAFMGRTSTGGKLGSFVQWRATQAGGVALDLEKLDKRARHWIIQEIGTNKRATLRTAGKPNPAGRPKKGATYVRTVKAQSGRRISASLVFVTKSGAYSPPPGTGKEQLYVRSLVKGTPSGPPRGMRIKKEIHGQHFVKKGGKQGFQQYRTSVLSAARQAFQKELNP